MESVAEFIVIRTTADAGNQASFTRKSTTRFTIIVGLRIFSAFLFLQIFLISMPKDDHIHALVGKRINGCGRVPS